VDRFTGERFAGLADRAAAGIAIVALVLSLVAIVNGRVDLGVTLARDGEYVRIDTVEPHSPARLNGIEPGMIVVALNGTDLVRLPGYVYPATDEFGTPIGTGEVTIEPTEPTPVDVDPAFLEELIHAPVFGLQAIRQADLENGNPDEWFTSYLGYTDAGLGGSGLGLLVGVGILVIGAWWLAGRAGPSLRTLAIPLAAAAALPFLVRPLGATWFGPAEALAGVLVPLGMVPLALRFAERITDANVRTIARGTSLALAGGAVAVGLYQPMTDVAYAGFDWIWPALVSAIALIPGLAAAAPILPQPTAVASSGGLLQSAELAVAGATPMMAIATGPVSDPYFFPFSVWLVAIAVAGRWTIRPLARLATRAQLQRDLIVAATEAERARVAADIHDDALQELTLLVRRLETAGDAEGADMARTVSDRLRAICGDLRLPILDDLGVGPALDWLVLRIERLAGGEVRLERADGTRPPPEVELAIFRVAQEALGNAVKHGKPPIVVRYHATEAGASLSVDDAGPGIEPDAPARAEQEGRFGLLNMQQRAEGIGAILDVRRWPGGGTHVALEWRPR
jgi:signal transduction histidine kinase